jgi:general stress protein CsbA
MVRQWVRAPVSWKHTLALMVVVWVALWLSTVVLGRAELWVFLAIAVVALVLDYLIRVRQLRRKHERDARDQG